MWAIIGGSGFESFSGVEEVAAVKRETPFGQASSGLRKIRFKGTECIFLPRHGQHHELTPTEVNYRANIFALKALGVKRIVAISAVGSLQKDLPPGDLVVPSQYIDRTKGVRDVSFCGGGVVGHVSLAKPIWAGGAKAVEEIASSLDFKAHFKKTYVCIEGPYFSTQAESNTYRAMGADIIGMTNFPEFALAREAGIAYLPCCFVTDFDCWDDAIEHVTLQEVLATMKKNNGKAVDLIGRVLKANPQADAACIEGGLKHGLMTPPDRMTAEQRAYFEVICS